MKFFCRNQSKFFYNFPIDDDGKVVRLVEFESMQDDHLTVWRDHLISSFSQNSVEHPFCFRTCTGALPQLTVLTMGKDVKKASAKSTVTSKRNVKRKAKKSKKDSVTKKGRARRVKESQETELSEASMTDGIDTYSDDEKGKDDPVQPRSQVPRKSAEHAAISIGRHAWREAKLMKNRIDTDASDQNAYYSEDEILLTNSTSLYLQTREMQNSTLLEDWKNPDFNPSLVSAQILHFVSFSTVDLFYGFCLKPHYQFESSLTLL
jgi:hypothetical protein